MLAEPVCRVDHILCILHGCCQRLFANNVVPCIQRLDGNVVVQKVRHTDVDKVAIALRNCLIIIAVNHVAGKAIPFGQCIYPVCVTVTDSYNLHFVQKSAVSIRMQVGRKRRADQKHT